ncbi:MAG TPA: selenide, water dikinase SelD [Pirellulales bacterium]|nr:selenide, water dikinase SelD [Pirellulales bacterium]
MNDTLPRHDVVLLGVGHTNAHVLRMWRMAPLDDCRLTCVSDHALAAYSGMLPGTLAGLYPPERMRIDLVRFCAAAGARLIRDRVCGLDRQQRQVLFDDRPPIPYDVLSIGIGSVPRRDGLAASDATLLPIKPMQTFLERLGARLAELRPTAAGRPLSLAVVGAGAGGVEICFCLPPYLRRNWPELRFQLRLIDRHADILDGAPRRTVANARRELAARGVELLLGHEVRSAADGRLVLDRGTLLGRGRPPEQGAELEIDLALWSTSAAAPPLLAGVGLPTDGDGFLLARPTLQSTADERVFVVGDSGTCPAHATAKAGVYAVRQGPVLWQNIRRVLDGSPCVEYLPQRGFLSLLATGDRRAILSYKGMSFHAGWCWKLKNHIDSRFMDMYQDYRPMPASPGKAAPTASSMRCAGCGGKVGGSVLSQVLRRLDVPPSPRVVLGLDHPDDAAIIRPPEGGNIVATVDFFTAFLDDPYLVGRVAALNALSDVFALGAAPIAALAMATIPVGPERQQEQLLYELLAGGLVELRRAGATLVGGHTIEAPQVSMGFTVLADAGGPPQLKGNLRAGDKLVLTKPLGSGILLAAHNQARLRAEWFDSLLAVLLASNQRASQIAREFDVRAITDVTGFGLAGHLLEMLRASGVGCELALGRPPLLPGVVELVADGVESTLAPANRAVEAEIDDRRAANIRGAAYVAMFDPQTSGGLLLGAAADIAKTLVARLREEGCPEAVIIGEVIACRDDQRRLRIV